MEPKVTKSWICKLCKEIVPREKRLEHIHKFHNPVQFFDYAEVIIDEWEK